ncbi:MAG: hypothetical protein J6C64_01395 [Lachnospiraceae bacterium]|nr:hypothetical protein [Lachnospiraceae bacterium]
MQQCNGNCLECVFDDCMCDFENKHTIEESNNIEIQILKSRVGERKTSFTSDSYFVNREKNLARQKDYYLRNREARLSYQKRRYYQQRDKLLAYQKLRYWQNREKLLAYQKKYNAEHRAES